MTLASSAARRNTAAQASPLIGGSFSIKRSETESQANRSATGTSITSIPQPSESGCKPPWTINAQHIKVFKAECLR
jgi:hypothetical protein